MIDKHNSFKRQRRNYFRKRQYGNEKRRIVKTKNSRREVTAYELRLDYKRRENFSLALFLLFSDFWLSITGIEVKSGGVTEGVFSDNLSKSTEI